MERIVIVGAGHAAGQLVASLRQKKFAGEIVLIGDERWLPYQRPPLSKKYLAGDLAVERLLFKPASYYDMPGLSLRLNTRVSSVDCEARSVTTEGGETVSYDRLVLATGTRPRLLDLAGASLDSVHTLRSIDDVDAIRRSVRKAGHVTILGAGYIGLEVAAVLRESGKDVAVVEAADRVMSRVVSPGMSEYYQEVHRDHGVDLYLGRAASAIEGQPDVESVLLNDGQRLATDCVIIGVGVVPNVELAIESGLAESDGIVVDDGCRTSDPNIFAIGDCTRHPNALLDRDLRLESVHNALEQAKTAAANLCGESASYAQVPWFWSDQYDLKLQIAGLSAGYDDTVIRGSRDEHAFACLYLNDRSADRD